jgi:hypothetical protein
MSTVFRDNYPGRSHPSKGEDSEDCFASFHSVDDPHAAERKCSRGRTYREDIGILRDEVAERLPFTNALF